MQLCCIQSLNRKSDGIQRFVQVHNIVVIYVKYIFWVEEKKKKMKFLKMFKTDFVAKEKTSKTAFIVILDWCL